MNIVIRVDVSTQIGVGHLMRCITLADELTKRGATVSFICRSLPGYFSEFLKQKKYTVHQLTQLESLGIDAPNLPQADTLSKAGSEADAKLTEIVLEKSAEIIDWLVIDHYDLGAEYETRMRACVRNIFVIDDLGRVHDCDLLLDQNLYNDMDSRYKDLVPSQCYTLLGPRFAMIRQEFREACKNLQSRDGSIRRMLIFFGGTDPLNMTAKALEAVSQLKRSDILVDVVVGGTNPHRGMIQDYCRLLPNTEFHCQVENMAEFMVKADLAIGAGGTTTWERCCLGLPSIVVSLAKNQEISAHALAENGRILYLGRSDQVTAESLASALSFLVQNREVVKSLSRASQRDIDGFGTVRVVNHMIMFSPLATRLATHSDCWRVFSWRNAEETRRYSLDHSLIPFDEHLSWFKNTLADSKKVLLIGVEGHEIGVLRYDFAENTAKVSIYLAPDNYGRGYGPRLLRAGSEWLRKNHPTIHTAWAEIKPENIASIKAFRKAGYTQSLSVFKENLRS